MGEESFLVFEVSLGVGVAHGVFDVECFEVGGEAFMEPHFGVVFTADGVSEIFVSGFVDDDEIPVHVVGDSAAEIAS